MKNVMLIWALVAFSGAHAQTGRPPVAPPPLSLTQALQLAEQNNLSVRAAQAERVAAEGRVDDTRAPLWNNPELTAERSHRKTPNPKSKPSNSASTIIEMGCLTMATACSSVPSSDSTNNGK